MKKNSRAFISARSLALSAMLTAMSVVIGMFCKNALNFGNGLFRITFENLPIILSGVVFGPVVGGIVGVASDLLSYLLSTQIYPPNLVVTAGAAAVGIFSGLVSRYGFTRRGKAQIIASGALAHIIGSMIIKPIGLYQFYGILVLWRIPLYLIIAPLEIALLCWLFGRSPFRKLIEQVDSERGMLK